MKKIVAFILVACMMLVLASCGNAPDTEKGEGVMTYAEYMAAAEEAAVVVEGYVQGFAFSEAYGNASFFIQDADGAYYVYRMPCTADDAAKLVAGTKVKVSGYKTSWSGEVEIKEATYEIEDGKYVAKATDVTSLLGTDKLIEKQNMLVSFKGATVKGMSDGTSAFYYSWDNSGQKGSNNDLYFDVEIGGATYTFTVESDEQPEGSAVYSAVEGLKIGDKIDLEGFLYWYNGAQPHITSVVVK
ncbi:MAG: hypothetical protein KBS59_07835 [Clostridiales bacterium]|nr:hypothetical protein [Clostridiales bacterium]